CGAAWPKWRIGALARAARVSLQSLDDPTPPAAECASMDFAKMSAQRQTRPSGRVATRPLSCREPPPRIGVARSSELRQYCDVVVGWFHQGWRNQCAGKLITSSSLNRRKRRKRGSSNTDALP